LALSEVSFCLPDSFFFESSSKSFAVDEDASSSGCAVSFEKNNPFLHSQKVSHKDFDVPKT
jgi:hypothetical protein